MRETHRPCVFIDGMSRFSGFGRFDFDCLNHGFYFSVPDSYFSVLSSSFSVLAFPVATGRRKMNSPGLPNNLPAPEHSSLSGRSNTWLVCIRFLWVSVSAVELRAPG